MKSLLLVTTLLLAFTAYSQNSRYVTVVATTNTPSISVVSGETAEIITCHGRSSDRLARAVVIRDGVQFMGYPPGYALWTFPSSGGGSLLSSLQPHGTTVAGPATISPSEFDSVLTVKITPETYDPNKTIIVPPGTNQVMITLESSTNLASWNTATNGIYGSPDTARFFRIRMDKLGSP